MMSRHAVAVANDNRVAVLKKPMTDSDGALGASLDYWGDLHMLGVNFQLFSLGPECLCFRRMRRRLCLRFRFVKHHRSFRHVMPFGAYGILTFFRRPPGHTIPFGFGSCAVQKFGSPRDL